MDIKHRDIKKRYSGEAIHPKMYLLLHKISFQNRDPVSKGNKSKIDKQRLIR